jgi:xylulokinase
LTGDAATDMSDAAGTLWLDVRKRAWSDEMLAATGLSCRHMPAVFEGPDITGRLTADVARNLGLPQIPVAAGAGDNAAGAIGAGVVSDGQAMLSLGTSGVIFVATAEHLPNPNYGVHAFCHALPGVWHQMSVMLSAAASVEWAARFCGVDDVAAFADMADGIETDLLFLPYLSGERTPHDNPQAMGVFFGLIASTDRAQAARAVLEGVAMGLADGFTALRAAGSDPAEISVIGGGARSLTWGRILASALNVPLVYRDGAASGPAVGAARLAHLAMGGDPAVVLRPPEILHRIAPGAPITKKLARFRALYRALAPEFRR